MGRANRKGQSMTYIAQDGRTALFELNPKKNDFVTVCHLTLKKGQSLNLIYLYTLKKLESLSFEKHFKERDERLLSYGFTKHGIKNIDTIHDLLSQEFMKIDNSHPENAYTISVAISEIMLSYDKIDGIIYPSLRSPLDYNIVLKNKSADRALRVKRCDFMEITKNVNREIFIRHLFTTSRINKQKNELIWSTNIEDGLGWLTEDTLSLVEFTQD
ncbi:MAG: RES family NAD+ phosphorylase [Saprospiraceae bacterium]|uniref:RES family NAD+ phosphorylase n=1 Tax=Candidatus Defluviibacterium haderslevense TaxID=2981993 RepID=A0A9D7SE99_9BACT|nr:RES family NAD+ phosphorylase [Candidatus Defluviibacterium haderslevense]